jgi:hypothetical protein
MRVSNVPLMQSIRTVEKMERIFQQYTKIQHVIYANLSQYQDRRVYPPPTTIQAASSQVSETHCPDPELDPCVLYPKLCPLLLPCCCWLILPTGWLPKGLSRC